MGGNNLDAEMEAVIDSMAAQEGARLQANLTAAIEYMRQTSESLRRGLMEGLIKAKLSFEESARDVAEGRLMRIPLTEAVSFPGALYIVTHREGRAEAKVMEALNHLVGNYFTRGAVFHSERWLSLKEHFEVFRKGEDIGFETAWNELSRPSLLAASCPLPKKPEYLHLSPVEYLRDIYRYLRCEVRRGIECALLDGQTLDEFLGRGEQPWPKEPEEDTPEALALEARIAEQVRDLAEMRLDVMSALAGLTPKELEAVWTEGGDSATRASRYRAMKKLRKLQG